jgi:hypothetical protein
MSLIRIRRERRDLGYGARKGLPAGRLLILLACVLALIWYLGRV